jgi:sugar lactone lactonase YvrE
MHAPGKRIPSILLLLLFPLLSGCGVIIGTGTAGAVLLIDYFDEEEQPGLPRAYSGFVVTAGSLRGNVEVRYTLSDAEGDPANLAVEYSADSGGTWLAATDAGPPGEGSANLSAPAGGQIHTFLWDAQADLPLAANWNTEVNFRVEPVDAVTGTPGTAWTSAPFTINVNTVPIATAVTPSGLFPVKVPLQYILLDAESDDADIAVEYSLTGSDPWSPATPVSGEGDGVTALSTSPTGEVHSFVWDCSLDLPTQVNVTGVYLRITPADSAASQFTGVPWVSDPIDNINYNSAPSILGSTINPVYSPATAVAVPYTLVDGESNPVDITVEYQKDGTGPWYAAQEASSGSDGVDDLSASPLPGDGHVFVWDFSSETASDQTVTVRISIADGTHGNSIFPVPPTPWTSNSFQINATAGLHTSIVALKGLPVVACDAVTVAYTLVDDGGGTGHPVNVRVTYSTDGGSTWNPTSPASATEAPWDAASEGVTSLSADPDGEDHVYVWDSFTDLGGADFDRPPAGQGVMVRVTSLEYGNFDTSAAFSLKNTWVASVAGGGGTALNSPGGAVLDPSGNVYICDTFHSQIRVLNAQSTDQSFCGVSVAPYCMAVIAGTGIAGFSGDNVGATQASLNLPRGIALDSSSPPNVYIADTLNHRIRRVDGSTGFITTVAGTGNAGLAGYGNLATQAEVKAPEDLCFDANGNLWIADTGNNNIRFLNMGSSNVNVFTQTYTPGTLEIISGQTDAEAGFDGEDKDFDNHGRKYNRPSGIAVDASGNVYVADTGNHRIRAANGTSSPIVIAGRSLDDRRQKTIAGNGIAGFSGDGGQGSLARIRSPKKIALDASANVYFADSGNHRIRAVDVGSGTLVVGAVSFSADDIETVAGGGSNTGDAVPALNARLIHPEGVALDSLNPQNLYIASTGSHRIRIVNAHPTNSLAGVATDQGSAISVAGGEIDTVAGAQATGLQIVDPRGAVLYGTDLYIADATQHQILKLDLTDRTLSVVVGTGAPGNGGDGGPAASAQLSGPSACGLTADGTGLLVADSGNSLIRVVNLGSSAAVFWNKSVAAGAIETLTSNPKACQGITVDTAGYAGAQNDAFIADTGQHYVRRITWTGGNETIVAGTGASGFSGDGGSATSADLNVPTGLCIDSSGNVFMADTGNVRIRRFIPGGNIVTVAGSGKAGFNGDGLLALGTDLDAPTGVLLDGSGDLVIVDQKNHCLRRLATGILRIVCGTGTAGLNGDRKPGVNTQLNSPFQGVVDGSGNIYLSDTGNRLVRRFHP